MGWMSNTSLKSHAGDMSDLVAAGGADALYAAQNASAGVSAIGGGSVWSAEQFTQAQSFAAAVLDRARAVQQDNADAADSLGAMDLARWRGLLAVYSLTMLVVLVAAGAAWLAKPRISLLCVRGEKGGGVGDVRTDAPAPQRLAPGVPGRDVHVAALRRTPTSLRARRRPLRVHGGCH